MKVLAHYSNKMNLRQAKKIIESDESHDMLLVLEALNVIKASQEKKKTKSVKDKHKSFAEWQRKCNKEATFKETAKKYWKKYIDK